MVTFHNLSNKAGISVMTRFCRIIYLNRALFIKIQHKILKPVPKKIIRLSLHNRIHSWAKHFTPSHRKKPTFNRLSVTSSFIKKRHPSRNEKPEVEAFSTDPAAERKASASTQNQAFNAILFLCCYSLWSTLENVFNHFCAKQKPLISADYQPAWYCKPLIFLTIALSYITYRTWIAI
jgi:hypothetical protein